MTGPATYKRGWPWTLPLVNRLNFARELSRVDITIEWWGGERMPSRYVFKGPFEPGTGAASTAESKATAQGAPPATLALSEWANAGWDDWGVVGIVTLPPNASAPPYGTPVFYYDREGKRHKAQPDYSGQRGQPGAFVFRAQRATLDDFRLVTIEEETRKRTYHNIHLAAAGSNGSAVNAPGVEVGEQAVLTAHNLAAEALANGGRLSHPPQEAVRLRECAAAWSNARDGRIREVGLVVALAVDFEAFADRALDFMARTGGDFRREVPRAFRFHAAEMTPAHVARVRDILLAAQTAGEREDVHGMLRGALEDCPLREAAEAIATLAESPYPALWCWLGGSDRLEEALGPRETWPLDLRAKWLIDRGTDETVAADPEAAKEAARLLEESITAELDEHDGPAFGRLYRRMETFCGRERTRRAPSISSPNCTGTAAPSISSSPTSTAGTASTSAASAPGTITPSTAKRRKSAPTPGGAPSRTP